MLDMPETEVAPSWSDAKYQDSKLAKGKRHTSVRRATRAETVIIGTVHMTCGNCGEPYALSLEKHCMCSPWVIGMENPLI
jgi:hypothetical protein